MTTDDYTRIIASGSELNEPGSRDYVFKVVVGGPVTVFSDGYNPEAIGDDGVVRSSDDKGTHRLHAREEAVVLIECTDAYPALHTDPPAIVETEAGQTPEEFAASNDEALAASTQAADEIAALKERGVDVNEGDEIVLEEAPVDPAPPVEPEPTPEPEEKPKKKLFGGKRDGA